MSGWLDNSSQIAAFLQDARERPEDDTPRLVLADFLEENGDADRAEFIRLQCRLAPGTLPLEATQRQEMEDRSQRLVANRGGGWLGRLWQWAHSSLVWHRGLVSVRPPRRCDFEALEDVLPWIDTALFVLHGRSGVRRVADLMGRTSINHLHLDLRSQMREDTLLGMLARLPESACLRSLGIHWPLAMLRRPGGEGERPLSVATASELFLVTLLAELPLGRHLTHLGTSRPFGVEQTQVIRNFGVVPVLAQDRLWMHRQPPSVFRGRIATLPSSRSLLS
jgi:uncharacterized protein (TIGR02996 family)